MVPQRVRHNTTRGTATSAAEYHKVPKEAQVRDGDDYRVRRRGTARPAADYHCRPATGSQDSSSLQLLLHHSTATPDYSKTVPNTASNLCSLCSFPTSPHYCILYYHSCRVFHNLDLHLLRTPHVLSSFSTPHEHRARARNAGLLPVLAVAS